MPVVHRGTSDGIEQLRSDAPTGYCAERYGRVVRAKCRSPGLWNALAEFLGENRHTVDVAGLALVSSKAQGRIPFDVLDGTVSLPGCQTDV